MLIFVIKISCNNYQSRHEHHATQGHPTFMLELYTINDTKMAAVQTFEVQVTVVSLNIES
jgi:hypothetical protein